MHGELQRGFASRTARSLAGRDGLLEIDQARFELCQDIPVGIGKEKARFLGGGGRAVRAR